MTKTILEFRGEYAYLSNFHLCSFTWDGITWPHSEAAYQAAKTLDRKIRLEFSHMTPGETKRRGRSLVIREDWEDIKLEVMAEIIFHKFEQNPDLKAKLLATEGDLEEGNWWGDRFWGVSPAGSGKGLNNLGKILMEYRDLCNPSNIRGLLVF